MKINLFFLSLLISLGAWGAGPSAYRIPGVSAQAYFPATLRDAVDTSAYGQRVPLNQLDISQVPKLSPTQIQDYFKYLRDLRFLKSSDSDFLRRISWLYPDDGCFVRAEVMMHLLKHHKATAPLKVFVFGDLTVKTPNAPSGSVSWWYHVAIIYRDESQVYVLDPAVEPHKPLALSDWVQTISEEPADVSASVCSEETYEPESDCLSPTPISEKKSYRDAAAFLPKEWRRLEDLQRSPEKELGDFPPWLSSQPSL